MNDSYKSKVTVLLSSIHIIRNTPWKTGELCLSVQLLLLKYISQVEKKIQRYKSQISLINNQFKKTVPSLDKNIAINLNRRLKVVKSRIEELNFLLIIFRSLGDSLAFIYIDKYDIKQFIFKENSGYISGKTGLKTELLLLKEIPKVGGISILNDLTNCLRHGDITVAHEYIPLSIIEAKSSSRDLSSTSRQLERTQKILDFLKTGKKTQDERLVKRVGFENEEINHHALLNSLVKVAMEKGEAFSNIETGLYYYLVKNPKPESIRNIFDGIKNPTVNVFMGPSQMPFLGYFPLALILNDPNAYLSFCKGELLFLIIYEPDVIKRKLESLGYAVDFYANEDFYFGFYKSTGQSQNDLPLNVSNFFFNRVIFEFLSLDWFISELDILYSKIPDISKLVHEE
jgi:hypothetical protein